MMAFLARLFGAVPIEERRGIRLAEPDPWRVSPAKDVERFVRALPLLAPEGAVVYVEGTGESHVADYLRRHSIPEQAHVAVGTIWPKPDVYHVPLSVKNMEALAEFLERNPAGYFCSHCPVYRDGIVLLEWHDAFTDDSMYVSRTISSDAIRSFAEALGSAYATGWIG